MLFPHLHVHVIFFIFISLRLGWSLPIDTSTKSPNAIQPRGPGGAAAKAGWNALRNHVKNSSKPGVFWSGTQKTASVKTAAEQHAKKVGGSTLGQDLKAVGMKAPSGRSAATNKWWDTASQIKAQHSKGPAHAVLGDTVRKDSVWNRIEKPALMKNEKVPSVSQIHPSTGKEVKKLKPK